MGQGREAWPRHADTKPFLQCHVRIVGVYLAPKRASASDAPSACERGAWLEPDQSVPGSKCVRRASHRLDGKTAPADVRKRVACKKHQIGVALVDPERDSCSLIRIAE